MKRWIAAVMCMNLVVSGCASASGGRIATSSTRRQVDTGVMAAYVRQMPVGSRIRVNVTDGQEIRGTLMKADEQRLLVQPRTRIPEPPIEIPIERVLRVELAGKGSSIGKAIGIGLAAGVGGALTIFAILAGIYSD
jgi:hypothetical protein